MRDAVRTSLLSSAVILGLGACSAHTGASSAAIPLSSPASATTRPPPRSPLPVPAATSAPVLSPSLPSPIPTSSSSSSADVTQDAAAEFVTPGATAGAASPAAAAGIDYADPLAVAAAYLARRLTYRYDDLAGYRAALMAPALTTPVFAARSEPNGAALAKLETAQETSTVQVGAAELAHEAPHTATTRYVSMACTTTTTYRGGGATAPGGWTLRLVQGPPGRWRVDGVLSTG